MRVSSTCRSLSTVIVAPVKVGVPAILLFIVTLVPVKVTFPVMSPITPKSLVTVTFPELAVISNLLTPAA